MLENMANNKTGMQNNAQQGGIQTHRIVAVRREDRDLVAFKLEDGTVLNVAQAIDMCQAGQLPDYRVGVSRADTLFIRNVGDGDPSNNLDNLPTF